MKRPLRGLMPACLMATWLTACTSPPTTPEPGLAPVAVAPPASPALPPPLLRYDDAVLSAATALLKNAQLEQSTTHALVIDPLIDGMTGQQSVTTRSMGERVATLVRQQYPQYAVQPFSPATIARSPLVLIGTFTGVNAQRQTSGTREAYRLCFALADLKTGKLVSKGLAFSLPEGIDATPLPSFRDAPAWTEDPATLGYIRTCQGTKAGDPINPMYLDRIVAAAQVAEAIEAYDAGKYRQALDLYTSVQRTAAGDQFRVYNGLYLANLKLGRRAEADAAFGQIVAYGLAHRRLAVKFLFRPGSTAFDSGSTLTAAYPGWLKTIASSAQGGSACLEVTGHTSPTGPEVLNQRLSLLRAEFVKSRLEASVPTLAKRVIANGVGSSQTLIGTGRDDASDALDRRVEFAVIECGKA